MIAQHDTTKCNLCDKEVKYLSIHYKKYHPEVEITPDIALGENRIQFDKMREGVK